jgi:hypothetical protein
MTQKLRNVGGQSPAGGGLSALIHALSVTHQQMQTQAARSVDTALVMRNWLFGWHIPLCQYDLLHLPLIVQ